jgi:NADP-dependent 3-hydroxy acid dehydrogenase YdfG
MDFADKTVVVTGAGSGLGRCLALQLGELGAKIACVDYNADSMKETGALLERQGTPFSLHRADVSIRADVERAVDEINNLHDGFDALINNAGIMQSFTTISNLQIEEIERITQVNYWGMVLFVKASLPILEARQEGLIVNISSLSALLPFPGQTAYSASKAAVRIFSEGLRLELADKAVAVALIMPGAIRTEIAENSPFHSEESKARFRQMSEGRGFGLSADDAARKILRAVRSRRYRLVLGTEAWLLDKCYRVAPISTCRFLSWAMQLSPLTKTS